MLLEACVVGDANRLQSILSKDTVDLRDESGRTGLMLACEHAHDECVRTLLRAGADVNARDLNGFNALRCCLGRPRCMRLILDAGADVFEPLDEDWLEDVEWLDEEDYDDWEFHLPVLNWAVEQGDTACTRMLIDAGSSIEVPCTEEGNTPLMDACQGGHVDIVRMLLDAGADEEEINLNGDTAKDLAANDACRALLGRTRTMRRWDALRRHVKHVRPVALFWLETTQVAICAPGGTGRARDLQAFEECNAGHNKRPMSNGHEACKRLKKTLAVGI